ncbi:MAG: hypothetical protein FGM32_05155 [Candidatus Kapabacteria bacterium]|nr:hypothetical protein [Candidatus Kapabacteria bacterium]
MRGIRTLFLAVLIAIGAIVSNAQVTVFVRSAADGGNNANNGLTEATAKLTIGGANGALAVAGVTTLDIGAGNFDGATTNVPLTINGANAGAAFANWGAATVLNTPITLGAADADLVVDGVTFGAGSTINGASAAANVVLSNCKFSAANAINTSGLGWEELSISGCQFDGNNGGAVANAIIANGLTTLFLTETTFEDYTSSAVTVSGNHENVVITSNELTRVNTGGSSAEAAIKIDAAGLTTTGSLRATNNIVSGATTTNGVVISGSLAGKTISVETNLFSGIGGFAIKNDGTGMLSAGCNAYGINTPASTVMGLLSGAIQAGPYNYGGVDNNGAGIGFVPAGGSCTMSGPVTITGSSNSYFRIQDGVTAVAADGTVTVETNLTFTENISVGKSLTIQSSTTTDYARATPWTTLNGTITVSIGAVNFSLVGMKVTSSTATQLVASSATGSTTITNCLIAVDPTAGVSAVPVNGAIHIGKSGDLTINGTKVARPTSGSAPFIRALTFAAGNACRNVNIGATGNNLFEGTLQFSGMSLLSDVKVRNSTISNAGIDGISFTGNTINTLWVGSCDIIDSRQHGIGIRDRVTVGNGSTAIIDNCEITGSGKSGSGYAAVFISSTSFGNQQYSNNLLHPQDGSNKPFINNRSGYTPTATCNWWGSKSQDVIEASVTGGLILDDGSNGWRRESTNLGGVGANLNFPGNTGCSVRAFTITLAPSNATCFGTSTGSITNTLGGTTTGATYSWTNGATTLNATGLAAGTYSVTVTTASENSRSKSATILEPTELSGTSAKTNVTCNAANDGTITVSNAAGGLIPGVITSQAYSYRIDRAGGSTGDVGPQSSASFTGLMPGTYDVYVSASGITPTCEKKIGSQTVTEPAALSATSSKTNITCNSATDGTITVSGATGGYGTYEYRLNTGSWQTSTSFTNLNVGTYSVQMRDAAQTACTLTLGDQVITRPAVLNASVSKTNITCSSATDGTITVTGATGGYGTYEYRLNTNAWQTSGSFTGLNTGTFSVQIRDAAQTACAVTLGDQVITRPAALSATSSKTNITCSSATDGTITVSGATGGYGTYEYRLNTGSWQTSTSFTNLNVGTYSVQMRDAQQTACALTLGDQVITRPAALSASASKTNITCNSATDGTITVSGATGGYGTYEYRLNTGSWQTSTSFTNLNVGTYSVQMRDAQQTACALTLGDQVITRPAALNATVSKTNITCNSATDGTITVTSPVGGYGTYEYRLNTGAWQSSGSFTGLNTGTFSVQIRDAAQTACAVTLGDQVITRPAVLSATVNKVNISRNNENDGTITVSSPTGGYGTYQYRLNTGTWQSSGSFTNLAFGTYSVQIRDAAQTACAVTLGDQVIYNPTAVNSVVTKNNISCNGNTDGNITAATATGGTHDDAPTRAYTYRTVKTGGGGSAYDVTNATGSFTGLGAGTYTVSVIAAASGSGLNPVCTTEVATRIIYEPTAVTSTISKTNISCNGSANGTITATPAAGGTHVDATTRTYTYRAVRTGGGSFDQTNSTGSFTGLGAGTYVVSVIAAEICCSVPVCTTTVSTQVIYEPSAVTSTVNKTNISCNGGTNGTISAAPAAGGIHTDAASRTYTYRAVKSGGGGSAFDQTNATGSFTGLDAGTYQVSVIAAASGSGINPVCTTQVSTQVIYEPSAVTATVNKTNITCFGTVDGTITVSSTAGGIHSDAASRSYTYRTVKTGGGGSAYDQTNSTGSFTGLTAGTYTTSVIAAASGSGVNPVCTTEVATRVIFEPSVLTGTSTKTNVLCKDAANGTITVTSASGGTHAEQTQTYQYRLVKVSDAPGNRAAQTSNVFTGLAPGTFDVYVIAAGVTPTCEIKISSEIITEPTLLTTVPAVTSNYAGAQLTCPNSSDGSIASNPGGGTTPYTYQWEKNVSGTWTTLSGANATAQNVTGLNAGTYRVTVTDANLCAVTRSVEIVPPAPAVILTITKKSYNGRDLSCFGSTNGEVTVVAQGGTGALKYSSNGGTSWLTGGGLTPGGDPTYTFTGLGAGTYTVLVQDVNGCNSAPQDVTITNPPTLEITSLVTNGPVNAGDPITFTATVTGGTRFTTSNKYTYSWVKPRPAANMPGTPNETVNPGNVVTTFTIPVTTPDDNGHNTDYILTVTDINGCQTSLAVRPIVYPSTIYVATSGNDLTGDGRSVNPLKTIQKAIDVAKATNVIEVQTGSFDESPVVSKQLTINGTSTTTLGAGRYFIYGTTSAITWGTSWPVSVWDNLGLNGSGAGAITTVLDKVNSNSSATLWLIGNISWSQTVTVSKQLAIRGATSAAAVQTYTGCDIEPPTTITYSGAGADSVLFKFTGSTAKSMRDLVLRIPNAGKFAEISNTSSGNVDPVTNVRFEWDHDNNSLTAHTRIYGVTNGDFSGGSEKFDVAKFVYDVEDNVGTGRFVYGNNGPLTWNNLEIGWKAEDGSVGTAGSRIKTLEPMKGDVKLQSLISNSRRPTLNTTAANYNGRWSMDFDAGEMRYLEANTSTAINGGSKKTIFLVFRPLDAADDQVIYKHGDEKNGMSIVQLADGRISMNVYDGTTTDKRESWIFESSTTGHTETGFDNSVVIAQLYFNGDGDNNATRRVGAALDLESGRLNSDVAHTGADKDNGYVGTGAFSSATLGTPANINTANVAVLGARSGSVYYGSWSGTAVTNNSVTTSGRANFFGGSVAELLILKDAAESTRDAAYCYLRNKYYGGSQTTQNGLDKRTVAGDTPVEFEPISVWPNPADDRISIEAAVPTSGNVSVVLRDAMGRVAKVLFDNYVPGGTLLPINAEVGDLVSGAYVIHVTGAGDVNFSLPLIVRH